MTRVGGKRTVSVRLIVVAALVAGALAGGAGPASAGGRWSIMRTPSPPGPPNGTLSSVSCASATDCLAFGNSGFGGFGAVGDFSVRSRLDRFHRNVCASRFRCLAQRAHDTGGVITVSGPTALVEHWNGASWSIVPGPASSVGYGGVDLLDISCPATNTCFAAGSLAIESESSFSVDAFVERWNGANWSVMSVPSPKGAGIAELNAIDCVSATSCVAVGDRSFGSGEGDAIDSHPLIERWNGTKWTMSTAPIPSGSRAEILLDASCSDSSNCTAVGAYLTSTGTKPLVERTTGGAWSVVANALPAGQDGAGLYGVSCPSASVCLAVGSSYTGTGNPMNPHIDSISPLAEQGIGTTWSITPTPTPPGTDSAELVAVACASATDCSAVGDAFSLSQGPDSVLVPVQEHWNGASWAVTSSPPDTPFARLVSVDCPSATACFAVGNSALVERWNGSTWALTPFGVKTSQSSLADVACMSATNCFAVGSYSPGGASRPLVEHWNGSQWRIAAVPVPSGSQGAALTAISCPTASSCTAVGSIDRASSTETLIEHWNGSSWNVVRSPSPPGAFFLQFSDVSCGAPKNCVAVGLAEDDSESTQPFAMAWNGSRWSVLAIPAPDFAETPALTGVSCMSRNNCFAVGAYVEVTGTRQVKQKILLLHWNGYRFKASPAARIPGDPQLAQLGAVSCSGPKQCLAVGSSAASVTLPVGGPLYETWNGTKWTVVPTNHPLPYTPTALECRSGTSCFALGTSFSLAGISPAVAHWNGRDWANVSIERPSAQLSQLSGLDCPSASLCFAAGSYQNVYGSFTLVLRGT